MTGVLLDTHAFIWWFEHDRRLSGSAREAVAEAAEVFLSIASCWEIAIKVSRNKLAFALPIDRVIAEHLIADPAAVLSVGRRNLARARAERPVQEQGWITEWEHVIEQPTLAIVSLLLADDTESLHLKQTSPFAGVISQDERLQAMQRVQARRPRVARAS